MENWGFSLYSLCQCHDSDVRCAIAWLIDTCHGIMNETLPYLELD